MTTQEQPEAEPAPAEHTPEAFEEGDEAPPPGVRAMAVVRWLLLLGMAGVAVLASLHVYGGSSHAEGHGASQYYCPMHPAVVQDQPGECPICGMSLVQRSVAPMPPETTSADDRAGPRPTPSGAPRAAQAPAPPAGLGPVEIPASQLQLIGMRTAQVTHATLPSELSAVGYVAPTESGLAVIQTRFSGWIEQLYVAETGLLVQRGQLLARVYSPELLAAQQELLNARKWTGTGADGTNLAHSARARLELMGMVAAEIDEVERSATPHRTIELRSPVRGYVVQKNALAGLYIQPGTRLFDIADLSRVWLLVELFERDAGRIQAGQPATLSLTAYPGESFSGKVELVYPTLDPGTRTQRARIAFRNPKLRLRPGMFGNVRIEQARSTGLLVPSEAVVDTGEQQYVFVQESAGRFRPRGVLLGQRFEGLVQVMAGLREGETVVTTGNFLLDSESRLRAAIAGSVNPASH
jgi:membrane fusion protein, copper/silver efflux system